MPRARCVKTCFDTPRGIFYPEGTIVEDLPVNAEIAVHFVGDDGKPIRIRPEKPKPKRVVIDEIGNIRKDTRQVVKEA
jgi:hypothetical protein